MRRLSFLPSIAMVVMMAGMGLVSGCGGTEEDYNDSDVLFASEMVPHHAQAIAMVDLVDTRTVRPEFRALAERIREAQQPEIDEMARWLEEWDKPEPATSYDTADGMDDMEMGGLMSGTMSHQQMEQLAASPDSTFERAWLDLMIAHHEGAVAMARTEIAEGTWEPAIDLARRIEATQSAEIAQMRALIDS